MMFILAFNLVQVFSIDNVYASDMDREEREQIRKEWEERQKRGGEKKWGRRRENTKSSKKAVKEVMIEKKPLTRIILKK